MALLLGLCACQAPRPNVLDELPGPRLMQAENAEHEAHAVDVDAQSWARIEWFAGRRRVAAAERPVRGQVAVAGRQHVQQARLQIDLGLQGPRAEMPQGLSQTAEALALELVSPNPPLDELRQSPQRAALHWNRRRGELPLELQPERRRRQSRSDDAVASAPRGTVVFENARAASIPLQDYGLGLSFEVEGERTWLTEARLTLHLHAPLAVPAATP